MISIQRNARNVYTQLTQEST